jgi:hypothetical protein
MLFYKCLKISLINFLNLPKKGAKRLFRLGSIIFSKHLLGINILIPNFISVEALQHSYIKCEEIQWMGKSQ